ncbi:MAG: S8 family serine peptidase, partial [Miltoncostaeaceae bacterium]
MSGLFPDHRAPLGLAAASAAIALAVLPSGAAGAADDELIVGFRSDTPALQSRAAHGSGWVVTRRLPVQGLAVVEPRGGRSRASLAAELADDHRVRFVEPNGVVRRLLTPDDPEFGAQWGLKNVGQTVDGVTGMAGADVGATSAWD